MTQSTTFEQIRALLDNLDYDEQLALVELIMQRLRGHIDAYAETTEEEEPEEEITRRNLPKVAAMLEWGVIEVNERLYVEGHSEEATLLLNKNEVAYDGRVMRINDWAKSNTVDLSG